MTERFDREAHERLRILNADHRRRIDQELADCARSGALEKLRAEDERSRSRLTAAMLGCAERWRMRTGTEKCQVLELGAALGNDIEWLRARFSAEYSGIEVVPELARSLEDAGVVCAPIEELPEEWSGRFHFIYSRHVMEHVVDLDRALSELRRVLAPNGVLGAVTPHSFPDPEPAHVTQQSAEEWRAHYQRHGLRSAFCEISDYNCVECHIVCVHDTWPMDP